MTLADASPGVAASWFETWGVVAIPTGVGLLLAAAIVLLGLRNIPMRIKVADDLPRDRRFSRGDVITPAGVVPAGSGAVPPPTPATHRRTVAHRRSGNPTAGVPAWTRPTRTVTQRTPTGVHEYRPGPFGPLAMPVSPSEWRGTTLAEEIGEPVINRADTTFGWRRTATGEFEPVTR